MNVKERLKEFINYKKISIRSFCDTIGVSQTYVNSMRVSIQPDKLDAISSKYPELNTNWLLTGKGSMLKDEKPKYNEVTAVDSDDYMMVEYADLRASAGYLGVGDVSLLPDTHKRLVPKEYANGKFMVVRVDGDSMYDGMAHSLSDGDEVLISLNEDGVNGGLPIKKTIFVITTRDGNVLKQISELNREEGYLVCHSWNKKYEDFKIKFEDIFQIFTVCKIVQKQISLV